jgi:hypothetical protein
VSVNYYPVFWEVVEDRRGLCISTVKQLIDITLPAKSMPTGEALNNFVKFMQ